MFSVNNNNKFEFLAYGPVEIVGNLGTILTSDVIDTSYTNRQEDAYNRFEVHYKYNNDTNSYGSVVTGSLANWTVDNERLLKIESKWIQNNNDADSFRDQVQTRYEKTLPVVNVKTSLNKSGVEVGDLLTVTDIDSGLDERVLQVRKFTKDFSNNRSIDFEMFDAETLYYGRGWAFWGTEIHPTTGSIVPTAVTNTSTFGWADGSDNVANINTEIYGDNFKWW
jgi:hypothetical protein